MQIGANGVATVRMVRADKHNALDQAMFEGLMDAAGQLADDASVRAVVLHGEGKSFCSGLDVVSIMAAVAVVLAFGAYGLIRLHDGSALALQDSSSRQCATHSARCHTRTPRPPGGVGSGPGSARR